LEFIYFDQCKVILLDAGLRTTSEALSKARVA